MKVERTRREAFKSIAGPVLGTSIFAGSSGAQVRAKYTFLLVHPAWHGGWCWAKVAPLLRRRGHDVYTPTLTGLGERFHLAHPMIGLDTHTQMTGRFPATPTDPWRIR